MYTLTAMARVLHIIDHNGPGGAQRVLEGILANREADLVLPLRAKENHLFDFPEKYPKNLLPNNEFGRFINPFLLPTSIRDHQITIVHCHLQASWMTGIWLALIKHRQLKGHILFHEHNPYVIYSRTYPYLIKMAGRTGKILVVSEHLKNRIKEAGVSEERLLVLQNYVSPQFFKNPEEREKEAKPDAIDQTKWVGFSGRLVDVKGWRAFLHAANMLREENIKFLIAGTGLEEKKIRKSIKAYQLEEKVFLMGFVADMRKFYRSLDLFFLSSQYETFGLVALEAQACGVPVVAFDIEGIRERLDDRCAMIVPPGNYPALAERIKQVLRDRNLRDGLVKNGLENARRFSLDNYLNSLNTIYNSLQGT